MKRWCPSLLERRRASGQRVTQVQVNCVVVRGLRRAGSHVPGIAHEVLVLAHEVDGAVFRVLPDGLVESKADLIDHAVLAVGGTGVAVAHPGSAVGGSE